MQVLSSISGLQISAVSAGFAPTNSADVSAIASAYQVVSATATQLNAGTAYLTSVNEAPISASRAGQAANASLASSAYYDGTGRLISALPDSAAVSAIASSYAESAASGKQDELTFGYDANNLISSIDGSALAGQGGGGGGSVSSPSGTISVTDGTAIEATNSAIGPDGVAELAWASALPTYEYDGDGKISAIDGSAIAGGGGGGATGDYVEKSATDVAIGSAVSASGSSMAQGSRNTAYSNSFAQGYLNKASSTSFAQGYYNNAYLYSFAQGAENSADSDGFAQGYKNTGRNLSFAQGERNSADMYSFAQGNYSTAYSVSFAQGSGVSAKYTATVFGKNNLSGNGSDSTGAAFVIGDGTASNARHDLMVVTKDGEITMFSGTADTVGTGIMSSIRAISAAATGGGGGVDSATVSAIASAYVESGVSSKLDASASSSFYTTANESGFVDSAYVDSSVSGKMDSSASSSFYTTANESGFVDSAYVDSAVSSKLDSSASSSFYTTANESGFVDSAYVDSSVSGKQDASAMSAYALSSDVSGTVDLVSSQSANWGGSALQLSAGPGVTLTKSGNLLVASTDETLLWSGSVDTNTTFATNESPYNFKTLRFVQFPVTNVGASDAFASITPTMSAISVLHTIASVSNWGVANTLLSLSTTGLSVLSGTNLKYFSYTGGTISYQTGVPPRIGSIYGINRTAEA